MTNHTLLRYKIIALIRKQQEEMACLCQKGSAAYQENLSYQLIRLYMKFRILRKPFLGWFKVGNEKYFYFFFFRIIRRPGKINSALNEIIKKQTSLSLQLRNHIQTLDNRIKQLENQSLGDINTLSSNVNKLTSHLDKLASNIDRSETRVQEKIVSQITSMLITEARKTCSLLNEQIGHPLSQKIDKQLACTDSLSAKLIPALKNIENTSTKHTTELSSKIASLDTHLGDLKSRLPIFKGKETNGVFAEITESIANLKRWYIPAIFHHSKIFPKYKGCHKNQDIVVVGTGCTLDDYEPLDAVHIGVNRAYLNERLKLDYLFIQDNLPLYRESLPDYRPDNCQKFFGMQYMGPPISEEFLNQCRAERYYFESVHPSRLHRIPLDISLSPFLVYYSVIFPAIQFALWTHPRRIYIVGCDCAMNGYSKEIVTDKKQYLAVDGVKAGWQNVAEFARGFYPDVEIISINPVGLKGLFRDMDMKNGELYPTENIAH